MSRLPRDRGQSSFDFLVGMGLFVLTVGFVFAFLPGMFEPFADGSGARMIVSERSAARLAEDALVASPASPAVLSGSCTVEFFDADGTVGDCRYDADADDLTSALGVADTAQVNVTIEREGVATLTRDGETATLAAGPAPPTDAGLIVSKRIVRLNGTDYRLFVRTW